ncbi:GatB/YqeY domain-containing protein [Kaarinaea lacus]
MSDSNLKTKINEDMKAAMRAKDKERLGVIRLILAAIKQQEVDTRTDLDDAAVLVVLDKMLKQRRDSISQYTAAGRDDLAQKEQFEVGVVQQYMPEALSEAELEQLIKDAITASGAQSMKDMGKIMNELRPKVQGRADMAQVSQKVKSLLA